MHMPVKGNVVIRRGKLSNAFGHNIRIDPQTNLPKDHQGWDIEAFPGTEVYAIKEGAVIFVADHGKAGLGKHVCLSFKHKNQTLYAVYAHLSSIQVSLFQIVNEGQAIGAVGRTGNANNQGLREAHLHFEIRTKPHAGRLDPGTVLGFSPIVKIIMDEVFPNGKIPGMK